jgi:hypothetical protein
VWIGYVFLFATIALYAGIGIMSRTADVAEYYVAGRRVPALFNGMATGSDWMSAASFIGMAGTLYLQGFDGLAFILGWTGGYCLVAFLLAPYLRKFGQFTIPDFLGARYGGNVARTLGIGSRSWSRSCTWWRRSTASASSLRASRASSSGRRVPGSGGHPGVLVPRRHARGDLDPGGAVHHPDRRLHDPRGVAVGEAHRRAGAAARLRLGAAEGHGRKAAD